MRRAGMLILIGAVAALSMLGAAGRWVARAAGVSEEDAAAQKAATQKPATPKTATSETESLELVLSGLDRPVRIGLDCRSGSVAWGAHFREARSRHLRALFAQLDSDGDGALSAVESVRLPPPRTSPGGAAAGLGGEVFVAFNFRVLDVDGDGRATPAELDGYLASLGDVPARLATVPALSFADPLFQALDTDHDGSLTVEEATKIERLGERDTDSNRVLTLDELRGRSSRQSAPEFVARPTGADESNAPLSLSLANSLAGDPGAVMARLSVGFSANPVRMTAPLVDLSRPEAAAESGWTLQSTPRGQVLARGNRWIILRVLPEKPSGWKAERTLLEQEFAARLENSPEGVPLAENIPAALRSMCLLADRDGNREVTGDEFRACLDRVGEARAAVRGACLRIVVFAEQAGLLPLVDLNRDGRLSRRELSAIPAFVKSLAGENGTLSLGNLPRTTLLVVQRGPFPDAPDRDVLRETGPSWFSRADRNGDGDLDRDEFLGEPADFERMDRNHDGWIDSAEAVLAEQTAPQGDPRQETP